MDTTDRPPLVMPSVTPVQVNRFEFERQVYNNGRGFLVLAFAGASAGAGVNGVAVGEVARFDQDPGSWFATADMTRPDDPETRRWHGPFPARQLAAAFLVGQRAERELPARTAVGGVARTRASVGRRDQVAALVARFAATVAALDALREGDSNDAEIDAGHDAAEEAQGIIAELAKMITG